MVNRRKRHGEPGWGDAIFALLLYIIVIAIVLGMIGLIVVLANRNNESANDKARYYFNEQQIQKVPFGTHHSRGVGMVFLPFSIQKYQKL